MTQRQSIPASNVKKARKANALGLQQYERWEIDEAIESFETATQLNPEEPEFHLNLARALARYGDFDAARRALGSYIRFEPDKSLAERFEQLFGEGMDEVETLVTQKMTRKSCPWRWWERPCRCGWSTGSASGGAR